MPEGDKKIKIGDYYAIMKDRKLFNQIVYTPLSEAVKLLDERRKDPELMAKVDKLLKGNIPEIFNNSKKYAILLRQVATPNYETKRFISIAKEYNLNPLILEFHDDKFTSNNAFKHSIGQLPIQNEKRKNDSSNVEKIAVIDFNLYNGKKFKDIKTLWLEPLVDFHKSLFKEHFKDESIITWDASELYKKQGAKTALERYKYFFLFFIYHGILFENYLTSKNSEGEFTRDIVLPAIEDVMNVSDAKPLIVPIEPLEIELDEFWVYHNKNVKKIINERKNYKK